MVCRCSQNILGEHGSRSIFGAVQRGGISRQDEAVADLLLICSVLIKCSFLFRTQQLQINRMHGRADRSVSQVFRLKAFLVHYCGFNPTFACFSICLCGTFSPMFLFLQYPSSHLRACAVTDFVAVAVLSGISQALSLMLPSLACEAKMAATFGLKKKSLVATICAITRC